MPVILEAMPGFLDGMGIPLRRGRALRDDDTRETTPVVVVSEAFADRYFGGGDPLGRRIRQGDDAPWITIVGVMADVRPTGPTGENEPTILRPIDQSRGWSHFVSVVFRATGDPASALPAVRSRLRELEPGAAVLEIGTYSAWLAASPGFAESRFRALVVGLLGGVALILALVGVYGVTAYSVRRRTRELGIRIALGGGERRVLARVLAEGLRLALVGIALGAMAAWFAVAGLEGFLDGMPARDPAVFGVVGVVLGGVALLACFRPALAASRVAPMEALRQE
jgi:putative ABC transport system permease protein